MSEPTYVPGHESKPSLADGVVRSGDSFLRQIPEEDARGRPDLGDGFERCRGVAQDALLFFDAARTRGRGDDTVRRDVKEESWNVVGSVTTLDAAGSACAVALGDGGVGVGVGGNATSAPAASASSASSSAASPPAGSGAAATAAAASAAATATVTCCGTAINTTTTSALSLSAAHGQRAAESFGSVA